MKINYKGDLQHVKLAVEDANEILYSDQFYINISEFQAFKCTSLSPLEISNILKKSTLEVDIKLYKPTWRFSNVLGYFVEAYPNNIFLNARKIYRETNSITNTIVHEYIHAVDYEFNKTILDFGHDCTDLDKSAPYQIGKIAEDMINGILTDKSLINKDLRNNDIIKILPNRILEF